jgi:predicted ArsR family transcriptional regulator
LLKQGDPKAAERFFREMAARLAEEHRQAFEDQSVERRLDVVVELLSGEGFTVRWEQDGDSFLVHELGCPYESLGVVHREVCCMDLGLIQEILPGEVVRERWRMEGDPACAYRVRLSAALEPAGAPGGR